MTTATAPNLSTYAASLQHIGLMSDKLAKLRTLQIQAEDQLIHRLASDYEAGRVGLLEVYEVYMAARRVAVTGFAKRWDARMPDHLSAARVRLMRCRLPDVDGNWRGSCPLGARDPAPPNGQSVVYVLFDAANVPCYVGSTEQFRTRLGSHLRDGKPCARWLAYPCADREAAYVLEGQLLRERKPYLNRKVGR